MWGPKNGRYVKNKDKTNEVFANNLRDERGILAHVEDVLNPEAMLLLLRFHRIALNAQTENGTKFENLCLK